MVFRSKAFPETDNHHQSSKVDVIYFPNSTLKLSNMEFMTFAILDINPLPSTVSNLH